MKLLVGETVYVLEKTQTGTDEFNAPIYYETEERVDNVLVQPGGGTGGTGDSMEDVIESNRPQGIKIAYTLHFPKVYKGDLAHKFIRVRGIRCSVLGHPDRYIDANTPGPWDMPVKVVVNDG